MKSIRCASIDLGICHADCYGVKAVTPARTLNGFTLIEMLTVIFIISILAALLLPVIQRAKPRALRIECINNLRESGLASHIFVADHNNKFATQVSTNEGGALEYVQAGNRIRGHHFYFSYRYFLPLAGSLATPKLLYCPADEQRQAATNFEQFNNRNLSYVVSITADPNAPGTVLFADRNIWSCRALPPNPTIGHWLADLRYLEPPYGPPHWANSLHKRRGNILFSDGHVDESSDANFLSEIAASVPGTIVYPDVAPRWSVVNSSGFDSSRGGSVPIMNTPVNNNPPSTNSSGSLAEGIQQSNTSDTSDAGTTNAANPPPHAKTTRTAEPALASNGTSPTSASPAGLQSNGARKVAGNLAGTKQSSVAFRTPASSVQPETESSSGEVNPQGGSSSRTIELDKDNDGTSSFDRQVIQVGQRAFAWFYLLLLIIFLVWLARKIRRKYHRMLQRQQRKGAGRRP